MLTVWRTSFLGHTTHYSVLMIPIPCKIKNFPYACSEEETTQGDHLTMLFYALAFDLEIEWKQVAVNIY